jgi:hypothetical protein
MSSLRGFCLRQKSATLAVRHVLYKRGACPVY